MLASSHVQAWLVVQPEQEHASQQRWANKERHKVAQTAMQPKEASCVEISVKQAACLS